MATTLTFDAKRIAALIAETRRGKKFKLTFDEKFDPDMHLDGQIRYVDGWPDPNYIDPEKLHAKLWLVKDVGICLMGNHAIPRGKPPTLVFAKGMSSADEGFREKSNLVLGIDDCCIPLPLVDFEIPLAANVKTIKIKVMAHNLQVYGT